MAGASIEATLELWASSLRKVKSLMRPLFALERAAVKRRIGLTPVSWSAERLGSDDLI